MAEALTPEQQNDALTKQVADLETKSAQKDATIADQKGQLKTQGADLAKAIKDRDQAVTQRDQAVAQRDLAKTDLAAKIDRVRELEGEAEANEEIITRYEVQQKRDKLAAEGGATVVTHEGQNYRVLVPQFHFEGAVVKAADLGADAATVAKLVACGSGVLERVAD